MISKAIKSFLLIDSIVIIACLVLGELNWLLNTQVAFISSLFVTIGSYLGYKKNVQNRAVDHVNDDDSYDELDKMDDRYDLYSPEVVQTEVKTEWTKEEIKEEIDKSKKAIKKDNTKNFIKGFSGMASLYRIAGYVFLIVGFFFLNNNGYLHIYSYLLGFIIVPISALMLNLKLKEDFNTLTNDSDRT